MRTALFEKRQRRATSRATGLELFLQLLDAAASPTVQRHVVLQLAQALKALQVDGTSSTRRCQFLHGCRGCTSALWESLEERSVELFRLLAARLASSLASLSQLRASAPPRAPPAALAALASAEPPSALDTCTSSAATTPAAGTRRASSSTVTRSSGSLETSRGLLERTFEQTLTTEEAAVEAAEEGVLFLINVFLVRLGLA